MSNAQEFKRLHPGVFFLDTGELRGMSKYLHGLQWLDVDEEVLAAERAGEGNMNYTVRVRTSQRTLIVKQARPWVEKYPHIEAPWDRALIEGRFYTLAGTEPGLSVRMPRLLGFDEHARMLCLEDLGRSQDFTSLYSNGKIGSGDLETLLQFLAVLHDRFRSYGHRTDFANTGMRELNHRHIFVVPLLADNGLNLDAITPGLSDAAERLKLDTGFKEEALGLGSLYLSEGDCLLHGDYFPGSWLKTSSGLKVIDPEFCFFGPPEFDLGVLLAHLHLCQQEQASPAHLLALYGNAADRGLIRRFAGIEIMRRLIGVAQLPLKLDLGAKVRLLEQSRKMVMDAA